MINNSSSSAPVAKNLSTGAETSAHPPVTSAQPTLSSREPSPPSMLPPRPSLHAAAKTGALQAIMYGFTTNRATINEVDPQTGLSPLQTALDAHQQDAAELLIRLGARVYDLRPGCTAENGSLHAASELGNPELLGKVLNLSKKDLNARDPISGLTPLSFALRGNHLDAARMLLEAGADPGKANRDGSLPLVRAARANNHEAVQLLLAHDAPIDQKEHRGDTALQEATRMGGVETVKLLLASGADLHQVDDTGKTVLFDVVAFCHPSITGLLLDNGIPIEHADRYGNTALCHATSLGHIGEAKILLGRGANKEHVSRLRGTPIMIAAENGKLELLELLLPAEKKLLDVKDTDGNTALHLAARNGHDAAVQALINAGAHLDLTNKNGNIPLTSAVSRGHIRAMALLLDAEPDLQKAATNAQKILDYAVKKGKVPVVEFLLQRGIQADDKLRKSAKDPLVKELLLHAELLGPVPTGSLADTPAQSLDASELMDKLLDTAARHKNADSWPRYLDNRHVSPTLSFALEEAANNTRAVWASLAGQGQKITSAQQKNWCAGILADLGNTMLRESPYAESGLAPRTQTVLETIASKQTQAMATAAASAEQPLREGVANLLENCRKAVSEDQFYPLDLFKLLTGDHGIYHGVASLIVSAFSDVWPRRNDLGDVSLERAFAEKLSALKGNLKALKDMNSGTAKAGNQATANMLMFRQLDLLQGWIDKWLGS